MAHHDTVAGFRFYDHSDTLSVSDRIRLALKRREVRRQIVNELEPLRDRELADIGISRADIPELARQHAEMTVSPASIRR